MAISPRFAFWPWLKLDLCSYCCARSIYVYLLSMSDGVLVPAPVDLVNGRGGEEKHGETEYHPRLASPIHHERHLRVACIGAGASGLLLAYKVQRSFDNFTLTLYEKNPDIAGTWYENKYPGSASTLSCFGF